MALPAKIPIEFEILRDQYKVSTELITFMTNPEGEGGLGLESLADFADIFTSESDVFPVLLDKAKSKSDLQASRVRQAWRGVCLARVTEEATKRKGSESDELDKLLPQTDLDDMQSCFWKRYKVTYPAEMLPADALTSRVAREMTLRLLSVREVWKTKCLSHQLQSTRKTVKLAGGATIHLDEDQDTPMPPKNVDVYLRLMWTLLLAYARAGCRPRDPSPPRPAVESSPADSVLFVQCPMDVLIIYHARAALRVQKIQPGRQIAWLEERDVSERTKWVERFRESTESLGTIIRSVFNEREACWEVVPEPPSARHDAEGSRLRRPRRGAGSADDSYDNRGPNPKKPRPHQKGDGKGDNAQGGARTMDALRNGHKLCKQWNTSGCKTPCADGKAHACDAMIRNGSACANKDHRRSQCKQAEKAW